MAQVNCRECKVPIERSDHYRGWVCPKCRNLAISDLVVAQNSDIALLMKMHQEVTDGHL